MVDQTSLRNRRGKMANREAVFYYVFALLKVPESHLMAGWNPGNLGLQVCDGHGYIVSRIDLDIFSHDIILLRQRHACPCPE